MNLSKPKSLKSGDTITIVAPSGNTDMTKILAGKKYFEDKGYKVKLGQNLNNTAAYLSATDEERLEDLHNAFCDSETNAIICARGGYGALRLINKIDYNVIKNNPKIFCGYSDITILNMMFLKKAGLITFSGPMIQGDFAQSELNHFTECEFYDTLTKSYKEIISDNTVYYSDKQEADGILIGGNLSTFASLCGIDFVPDEKFIFFCEDLNEPVYKIDRYFTQLLNISQFRQNVSAICLGDFLGIEEEYIKDFDNLFKVIAHELDIPVVKGFKFSHTKEKTTVPYGSVSHLSNGALTAEDYLI